MSTSNLPPERRAEIARNAAAAKLSHKGGRPRSCDCGKCTRCRNRASEKRSREKKKALAIVQIPGVQSQAWPDERKSCGNARDVAPS